MAENFGPVIFGLSTKGRTQVAYLSRINHGSMYLFNKNTSTTNGIDYYSCVGCKKARHSKQIRQVVPLAKVEGNCFVMVDPENPKNPHFCDPINFEAWTAGQAIQQQKQTILENGVKPRDAFKQGMANIASVFGDNYELREPVTHMRKTYKNYRSSMYRAYYKGAKAKRTGVADGSELGQSSFATSELLDPNGLVCGSINDPSLGSYVMLHQEQGSSAEDIKPDINALLGGATNGTVDQGEGELSQEEMLQGEDYQFYADDSASGTGYGEPLESGLQNEGATDNKTLKLSLKIVMPQDNFARFTDFGGYEYAKSQAMDFVNFMGKQQQQHLGHKVLKGAILVGDKGCGKSLLARTVAAEAGVAFVSLDCAQINSLGEDIQLVQIKSVFKRAKQLSTCVVYLKNFPGSFDFSNNSDKNTAQSSLTQCLFDEIEGLAPSSALTVFVSLVVHSQNDASSVNLKPFLEAGRFDYLIKLVLPDWRSRVSIFNCHLRNIHLSASTSAQAIATKLAFVTEGFDGFSIARLCEETVTIASRANCDQISFEHFDKALLSQKSQRNGPQTNKRQAEKLRRVLAIHNAAHAVFAWLSDGLLNLPDTISATNKPGEPVCCCFDEIDFSAQGLICSSDEVEQIISQCLVGRAAELLFFGRHTTLCSNDLAQATKHATAEVTQYGMGQTLGLLCLDQLSSLKSSLSATKQDVSIVEEIKAIISKADVRSREFVIMHKSTIERISEAVMQRELVTSEELTSILQGH